ncbi:hypothetical protein OE181_25705, partial [Escherichia coli]|uniref:hypothetical protein n=1 Tax=Escherichia coli TaxID=562 RepID=UPI0021F2D9DE
SVDVKCPLIDVVAAGIEIVLTDRLNGELNVSADSLPLKVFQSVEVSCPDCPVVAFCKVNVIAGVVVALATDPLKPFAVTTETDVTVPE